MGRVYLALDPNIDRKVALKVLEPLRDVSAQQEEELRRRFVLEARAAGRLKHRGIVTVYDAETDPKSGSSFIAMEWVDGPSLEKLLQQEKALPTTQAMAIVEQVAVALDSAHREGLVHRDIKPANILLDQGGEAKISDFGIAKFTSMSHTVAGQILGSPFYMSPEQVRNETVDGRSDLFSLGIVLYQAVTGGVPFDGDSMASITYKILEIDPIPSRSLQPEVTQSLAQVIDRALQKSPADRFQSGHEFAEALRAVDPKAAGHEVFAAVDPAASPPAAAAGDSDVPRTKGTGTLLLPSSGREAAASEDARARGRKLWALLSSRPRISLAALTILSVLVLVTFSWRRQQEEEPRPSRATEVIATVEPEAAASPVPAGWATLDISYKNRLRNATLTIWIDGEKTWSEKVTTPKGLLKRAAGRSVRANLMLPEGGHVIEVRVDGDSGKVHAAKRIEAVFQDGQTRRLGVVLIPPNILKLSWKD